ncbi:hypothetical protein NMY22_g5284 [Coprinellus aureogranulatus]|nr:hypothetical protein NMY22_g5284 [Coprinellus aureogranulatus]
MNIEVSIVGPPPAHPGYVWAQVDENRQLDLGLEAVLSGVLLLVGTLLKAVGGTMGPRPRLPRPSPPVPAQTEKEMLSYFGVNTAATAAAASSSSRTTTGPSTADADASSVTVSDTKPAPTVPSTSTPFSSTGPGLTDTSAPATSAPATSASAPVFAPFTGLPLPSGTVIPPPIPSASSLAGGSGSSGPPGVQVPLPSNVIPGFHTLGEVYPVPAPENAVFCTEADGPPFYTVTRGKRVGCFGGWDMVAPYVVGVNGVAFNKKPTLHAAYEAYVKAYERPGFVKYI